MDLLLGWFLRDRAGGAGRLAGREFGHHLGLPQALAALPLAPLVPGYAELLSAQRSAGLRHIGEALTQRGEFLYVLDGLYVSNGLRTRRRVDERLLGDLSAGDGPVARLAGQLGALHRQAPRELRRIALYQLIGLLQDHPRGDQSATALDLRIHPDEAAGVVAAAQLRRRLTAEQRRAAESLADAWAGRRLRRARRLLDRLGLGASHGAQDPPLAALDARVTEALLATETDLDLARRAAESGDTDTAETAYLRALRRTADERRALFGLVRLLRPESHARQPSIQVELLCDRAELTWPAGERDARVSSWQLLRLRRGGQDADTVHTLAELPELGGAPDTARVARAADTGLPLGDTVRYVALPLNDGHIAGAPLVSRSLVVAPDVGQLRLCDGREHIRGDWRRPPGAVDVTVAHTGPGEAPPHVPTEESGFTARGLAEGEHRFRVVCHYVSSTGRRVASPGVVSRRTVHSWPDPVTSLTARPSSGGGVHFAWSGGRDAQVRLVDWPSAPSPGTELGASDVPPPLPWPARGEALCPPPGTVCSVTAVAVLGERAVAGPAVAVEAPHPVTGLRAERLPDGEALVHLDWPPDAVHLTVTCAQDGEPDRTTTVTSHSYRHHGLRLAVGPGAARIMALPAPRSPGAAVCPPEPGHTLLPPDAAIAYRYVQAPRLPWRRSRALLRVTLSSPSAASPAAIDVPEFVCVARNGTLRPRHAADGATVVRISGEELLRHGTVDRALPSDPCPAPYTLRGFLLGESAAAVRLEEPSPATLVVR